MGMIRSVYDVVLDRTPAEILGAIGIAVALSMAISGLFALLHSKVGDRVLLVVVLLIIASIASMGLGAGFVASVRAGGPRIRGDVSERFPPPGGRYGRGGSLSGRIIEMADADGDGRLSAAEASIAAGRFVDDLTEAGNDSIDHDQLMRALSDRIGGGMPPPTHEGFRPGGPMADHLISEADRDRDGRLTVEEAADFLRSADEDGNGTIGRRELIARLRRGIPAPPSDLPPRPGTGNEGVPAAPPSGRVEAEDSPRPPSIPGERPTASPGRPGFAPGGASAGRISPG